MRTKKTFTWTMRIAVAVLMCVSTVSVASAQSQQAGQVAVRQNDSLVNGALIGAGAGIAGGLLMCSTMEPWDICREDYGSMAKFGALGAGIGMGIDALIRKTVYRTASGNEVHAAPILGRRVQGVRFSLSF